MVIFSQFCMICFIIMSSTSLGVAAKMMTISSGRAFCQSTSLGNFREENVTTEAFHCVRGKAYLFNNAVNITVGESVDRLMLSGMHTVADIFCCCCGQIVGWKYEAAHDKTQKYKEGKFVLERGRIIDGDSIDHGADSEFFIDTRPMSDGEDA